MTYILIYFLIGVTVALLIAALNIMRGAGEPNLTNRCIITVDVFMIVALAWPVSISVFVWGACRQLYSNLSLKRKALKSVKSQSLRCK